MQDIAAPLPQVLTARQGETVDHYLRGLGLVAEHNGATGWQYHLPDALGSVRQMTNPAGQITLAQHFDPFGALVTSSGGVRSAYAFAGEEQDPTTDQLYLRARTYNPATGRFLQQDSVIGSPAQPRTLHRYAYAFNNPVNYLDPSGHTGESVNTKTPGPQTNYRNRQVGSSWAGALNVRQNTPNRSVNTVRQSHPTYSDPYARRQSQGHRSALCSLWGVHDVAAGVFADVEKTIRDPQAAAKRLALQAGANWQRSSQETRDPDAWRQFWREWGDVAIGFTPADFLYDAVNIFRDTDLITGKSLTTFDKALMVVGVFTAGFGDDIIKGGGRLLRNLDKVDAADAVRAGRGLGRLNEGIDAVAASHLKHLDDFTGGGAGLRGDGLRRALAGGARSGGLNKKIRAARAWSEAGADLSDPSVRGMIRRGRGPVVGGSGALGRNSGLYPDGDPKAITTWVQQKVDAGEIDDIIAWAEKNAPTKRVGQLTNIRPEIKAQLRKDLQTLQPKIKDWDEGPPSPELVKAIRDTMASDRRTAGGAFLGRTIPRGSEQYYGHLPLKPVGGSALLNGENGLRLIRDAEGNVYFAVSDLDAGVVITKNGDVLPNDVYKEIFIENEVNINTRLTDLLTQKTGGHRVMVVDHGPHVNLMGKDVPEVPPYKIPGLSDKGAEFNYEVTSDTVRKVWMPTYIEGIPGVSGNIAQEYLKHVKDFRGQYSTHDRTGFLVVLPE